MGKKRATKDRAYITATEWREEGGGHRGRLQGAAADFKRLPFHCCALTFQPFEDPVATPDGTVMDIVNAVPYVTKHRRHPATGEPLELKDLVRLHFHKNGDGEYACPVLGKVFNENTHIVAVRPTGNVYCWEAVSELCLKPKNLRDLVTDEPFTRADIIHIQDPLNLAGKNRAAFDHVVAGRTAGDAAAAAEAAAADPLAGINAAGVSADTRRALAALGTADAAAAAAAGGGGRKAQAQRALADAKAGAAPPAASHDPRLRPPPRDPAALPTFKPGTHTWATDGAQGPAGGGAGPKIDANAGRTVPPPYSARWTDSHVSSGAASKATTSTAMPVATTNDRVRVRQQLRPSKKGYLRLHTTLGDLNLELHCDVAPATCENFLALADAGYYNGTPFHRSIKNFMVQGGDPTGTGTGGTSVFGPTFPDEIAPSLRHEGRGVLSMANSGKNTNGSQFFILYKSAPHLNGKHTVFGRVVGGFEALTALERVPTDDEDRPLQEVTITGATVFVNPYTEMLEEAEKEKEKGRKRGAAGGGGGGADVMGAWFSDPAGAAAAKSSGGGVGKYLKLPPAVASAAAAAAEAPAAKKAKTAGAGGGAPMANFDAW